MTAPIRHGPAQSRRAVKAQMTAMRQEPPTYSLRQAILDAGGVPRSADEGAVAFRWQGRPQAFVFLTRGKQIVRFRTADRQVPWAEYRAVAGQDCMPVTAAILSGNRIGVRATCATPCEWIELAPTSLILLVHRDMAFRKALFATHARRLPAVFARTSSSNALSLDCRLADWLLSHALSGEVSATHGQIATDLMTAREVVSRRLRDFAMKGWIVQRRGLICLDAPAALARLARGTFSVCAVGMRGPAAH